MRIEGLGAIEKLLFPLGGAVLALLTAALGRWIRFVVGGEAPAEDLEGELSGGAVSRRHGRTENGV